MNCTQAQTLLDAYADHALPAWQTVRVRRHLAGCPACTAQLADLQRLSASVYAWHDASAPAALQGRIAAALPQTASAPTPPRPRRIARRVAVSLAGVAAAIGAGFWLLPGHPTQPTLAFADVERAMQQVQTVSWKDYSIFTDVNWRPLSDQKPSDGVTWLRRNPAAVAIIGLPYGSKSLYDKRGSLDCTAQGNCFVRPSGKQAEKYLVEGMEERIKRLTQEPVEQSSDPHESVYNTVTKPQQQLVTLDGQKSILFTFDNEIVVRKFVLHGRVTMPESHRFQQHCIWVNPTSHLVTRMEARDWGDKASGPFKQHQIIINSDFRYNQAPPPGVFDWSPPPGAKVERH